MMSPVRFRLLPLTLCVAVLCMVAPNLWAQASEEVIQGKVTDQTGGAVPGVEVTATNVATGITQTNLNTEIGNYRIIVGMAGVYRVDAILPGFKTFVATDVEVNVGQVLRLDVVMEIGDITETIQVIGEAGVAEIQKDTYELSTVINEEFVDRMPVSNRKAFEVVVVAPAVTYRYTDLVARNAYTPWFSVAGSGPGNHIWKFDGANAQGQRVTGGQVMTSNPPPDVMKQVRVVTNNYSAEFGGGDGALFIMESKSGTNRLRGSLYYYGRNDAVDARPFFAQENPPLRKHLYGGYFGGPVVRDRAHFLISLEREKTLESREFLVTVPSLRERAGDFSQTFNPNGSLRMIHDPATTRQDVDGRFIRDPFPGNTIPQNRFDPVAARVMNMYPEPNLPGTIGGALNFQNTVPLLKLTRLWQMYRLDYNVGNSDSVYWRTALEPLDAIEQGPFGPLLDVGSMENRTEQDNHVFGWDRVWSATFTNSFRFSTSIYRSPRHVPFWRSNWAGQLGLQNLKDDAFPRFDIQDYRPIGQGWYEQNPEIKGMRGSTLEGSLVFLKGNHTLKVGSEFMHSRAVWASRGRPSGISGYDRRATWNPADSSGGKGGASFLLGQVANARFDEGPVTDLRGVYIAGFVQDDWRIHPDLTLNLGLRYEYDQPKVDVTESHNLFDPNAINPVCSCPGVVKFSSVLFRTTKVHTAFYNKEPYRFVPRFGFAWTPGGREDLVVRGGYGILYVQPDAGDNFWNRPMLGRNVQGIWITFDNGLTPAFDLSQGFPLVQLEPLTDGFGAVPIDVDTDGDGIPNIEPRKEISWFAPKRKTKYRQLFNFSIQKRFADMVFEIGYLGNIGRRMPARLFLNELEPRYYGVDPRRTQSLLRFPQFVNVDIQGSPSLSTTYHAGLLLLRGRLGPGLHFQTNYTMARHLENTNQYRGIFRIQDSYGPSHLEVRHRFVWSSVWELPWGPGKRWMTSGPVANALGGWSMGVIFNAQSRSPSSVSSAFSKFDTRGPNQRPDRIQLDHRIHHDGFDPALDTWFDGSAFDFVPDGDLRLGDAGPGILVNPARVSLDASLFKSFQVTEGVETEVRVDFFNALNNTNWDSANSRIGSPGVGRISSTERARILEYSLRIVW